MFIKASFQDPYAKRFMKDEKVTKTAYIANSGGLLGLCMGFSLVSAAEILYHCLLGLFSPFLGDKEKRQEVNKDHVEDDKPEAVRNSEHTTSWSYVDDVESGQGLIGKLINYETPETDTFSSDSQETVPSSSICEARNHNCIPELCSNRKSDENEFPKRQHQDWEKSSPQLKPTSQCYSRNTRTPCVIHDIMPSPQLYGPYRHIGNSTGTQRHFTSPTCNRKGRINLSQ